MHSTTCDCGAKLVKFTMPSGSVSYICAATLMRFEALYGKKA
jgi:hypothetical protein